MPGTGGAESASRQPEMRDSWGVSLEKLGEQSGVERDPSMQEGKGKRQGPRSNATQSLGSWRGQPTDRPAGRVSSLADRE